MVSDTVLHLQETNITSKPEVDSFEVTLDQLFSELFEFHIAAFLIFQGYSMEFKADFFPRNEECF